MRHHSSTSNNGLSANNNNNIMTATYKTGHETRTLLENRSNNGSCVTELSDSNNNNKNNAPNQCLIPVSNSILTSQNNLTSQKHNQSVLSSLASQVQSVQAQRFGTIGTSSWAYTGNNDRRFDMPVIPRNNNNNISPNTVSNTNLGNLLNDIPEIDVEDLRLFDHSVSINNDIRITKGSLKTKANLNDSELFEIPISQLEFSDTAKAIIFLKQIAQSKNCQYIVKPEGIIKIANLSNLNNSNGQNLNIEPSMTSLIQGMPFGSNFSLTASNLNGTIVKIITEEIEVSSLRTYLIKNDSKLSYSDRLELIYQCAQAIEFCHSSMNHVFDKLTVDNFVVVNNMTSNLSNNTNSNISVRLLHFNEKWSDINNLDMYKYLPNNEYIPSFYNNIWQFGTLMHEIISSPHKYAHENISREAVRAGLRITKERLEKPDNCGQILYNLMNDCWAEDFMKRPSMNEIQGSLRKIITNQYTTTHKPNAHRNKLVSTHNINNNNNNLTKKDRSYSSIGTLESSSNDGQKRHHSNNSNKQPQQISYQSKIKLNVVPNADNTCDIVTTTTNGPGTIVEV